VFWSNTAQLGADPQACQVVSDTQDACDCKQWGNRYDSKAHSFNPMHTMVNIR